MIPRARARPLVAVAIIGVLVLAFSLRAWGSLVGLPHAYHPDERDNVATARQLRAAAFPQHGIQPAFLYLSLWAVYRAIAPVEPWLRGLALPAGHALHATDDLPLRLWVGRLWLALLSTATAFTAFLLANRLAGAVAGLIAATLFAASPLAIAAASYVKEDTPVTLWFTVTTLAAIELRRRPTRTRAALAGIAAGLATSSKHSGVYCVVLVGIALWFASDSPDATTATATNRGSCRQVRRSFRTRMALVATIGFIAAFAIMTPAVAFRGGDVLRGVVYQAAYATTGHHDKISLPLGDTLGVFYLGRAIVPTLGLPALLAGLLGLAALWRHDRGSAVVLAAASAGYLALIEVLPAKPYPFFARYSLPAVPAICVLAGVGCTLLARSLVPDTGRRRALAALAALIVVAIPVARTVRFVAAMYPDTRDEAARWMLEHVPEGTLVLATAYGPPFPAQRYRRWPIADQRAVRRLIERPGTRRVIVLSDFATARFSENPDDNPQQTAYLGWLATQGREIARFASDGPRFGFYNPTLVLREIPADPNVAAARAAGAQTRRSRPAQ